MNIQKDFVFQSTSRSFYKRLKIQIKNCYHNWSWFGLLFKLWHNWLGDFLNTKNSFSRKIFGGIKGVTISKNFDRDFKKKNLQKHNTFYLILHFNLRRYLFLPNKKLISNQHSHSINRCMPNPIMYPQSNNKKEQPC